MTTVETTKTTPLEKGQAKGQSVPRKEDRRLVEGQELERRRLVRRARCPHYRFPFS